MAAEAYWHSCSMGGSAGFLQERRAALCGSAPHCSAPHTCCVRRRYPSPFRLLCASAHHPPELHRHSVGSCQQPDALVRCCLRVRAPPHTHLCPALRCVRKQPRPPLRCQLCAGPWRVGRIGIETGNGPVRYSRFGTELFKFCPTARASNELRAVTRKQAQTGESVTCASRK